MNREQIRQAFRKAAFETIRVTPEGFEFRDNLYPEITGRVRDIVLTRKLFEEQMPICFSLDGVRGSDGKLCEECQHPKCLPRLRMEIAADVCVYVVELNATSARNFFDIEDLASRAGDLVGRWLLTLTVVDHGHWGEVRFRRA